MKRLSSEMRGWEKEISRQQAVIDDCVMQLEDLKWVAKAEGMIVAAEQLQAGVRRLEGLVVEGNRLLAQLVEEQQVLDEQKKLVELLSVRTGIARALYNNINDLKTKIEAAEKYNRELWMKEEELAWAKQILQMEESIQECRSLWKQVENTRSNVEKGNVLLAQLDSLNKAQGNQAYMMRYAKEKIQEIRDNLPPVCPLCGQEIKRKEK
jgi:DNA repair exonuclease SbcCD ATPase subunit